MTPPKRKPQNKKLPARWTYQHGAYYYIVPESVRHLWDGKKWYRLGASLSEAHRTWADKVERPERIHTIGALLDRYVIEELPKKSPKTITENTRFIRKMRPAFEDMNIEDLEPLHVYQYYNARSAKVSGKREIEILSHAFTKAVEWGLIRAHPFKGEVTLRNESEKKAKRYVEDWEIAEILAMQPYKKAGSLRMLQAYIRLKLRTGLRQRDLLLMKVADCKDDGIHFTPSKTRKTVGKSYVMPWDDDLREIYRDVIAARPVLSPYLFCNRFGQCLVKEDGTAKAFDNLWHNMMRRVMAETDITEKFTEHDLRRKVGSDEEDDEQAMKRLTHSDKRVTREHYRAKPEILQPAKKREFKKKGGTNK